MTRLTATVIKVDLQQASSCKQIPDIEDFTHWVHLALSEGEGEVDKDAEISIRIVDESEIQALNHHYRGKDQPTNVLSFPATFPAEVRVPLLGDVVVCAPVIEEEAGQQQKARQAHWAHMVIHGTLHLLGYDHAQAQDAAVMEALEVKLLRQLGYPDPYL